MLKCRYAVMGDLEVLNTMLVYFHTRITEDDFLNHPFSKYIVLTLQDKIIGYLNYEKMYERFEIDFIYIKDLYRNKGYASFLLSFFLKEVSKEGGKSITLEVAHNNQEALSLYKKFGFQILANRRKYYGNVDGYLMGRKMG